MERSSQQAFGDARTHPPSVGASAAPEGAPQSAAAATAARPPEGWEIKEKSSTQPTIEPTDRRPTCAPSPLLLTWVPRSLERAGPVRTAASVGGAPLQPARSPPALPRPPTGVGPAVERALPGKYISYCTVWEGHDLGNCGSPSLTPAFLPSSNLLRTRWVAGERASERAGKRAGQEGAGGRVERGAPGREGRARQRAAEFKSPPGSGCHWLGLPPHLHSLTPPHPPAPSPL